MSGNNNVGKTNNAAPQKKKFWTWFFVIFNVIAILFIVLMERKSGSDVVIWEAIWHIGQNAGWFFCAVLLYFAGLYSETFAYSNLIYATTKQLRIGIGARIAVIGKYYDNLTPLATGGQPFQIYTLTKSGTSPATATSVVITKYFIKQIVFDLIALAILIFSPFAPQIPLIKGMAFVGLAILVIIPVFLIYVGFSKKYGEKILDLFLKILHKIKVIKDLDATRGSIMKQVVEFRECVLFLAKSKVTLVFQVIMSLVEVLASFSIPYFVYRAFGMSEESWLSITTIYVYCNLAVSIVPTPGTSGAAEASFYTAFSGLITNGMVFWALLLWRFLSFYVYILAGVILQVNDAVNKLIFPQAVMVDSVINEEKGTPVSENGDGGAPVSENVQGNDLAVTDERQSDGDTTK